MTQAEIKQSFHNLIDEVDDDKLLEQLFRFMSILKENRISRDHDWWDDLTQQQKEELDLALMESEDEKNLIPHSQVMKEAKEWLKK